MGTPSKTNEQHDAVSPMKIPKRKDTTGGSEDCLVDDPPSYIPPDQQVIFLPDITSELLHSSNLTDTVGKGSPYLSPVDSFPCTWPATGIVYGYNKRLMINLACRRARPDRGHSVLNVFFVVDTASPYSYLCQEAMEALLNKPKGDYNVPSRQLEVVIQTEESPLVMNMSPLGTPGNSGKFRDVNLLGMDFFEHYKLCMMVDVPIRRFKLLEKDLSDLYGEYDDD